MQRDARIDIVRGAGVLMIAVDHLSGAIHRLMPNDFVIPFITWTRVGWSSAAEFFVFFSGYLVGLVYSRTLTETGPMLMQARGVHRAWEIYAVNVLTTLIVVALLYGTPMGTERLLNSAGFTRLMAEGGAGWVAFLTLQEAPMFSDVLQLYVGLLLVAPLVLLIARVNVWAAFSISFATWLAVQFNPSLTLSGWTFNPFAWQFVFVLGMLCSTQKVLERIEASPLRNVWLMASIIFIVGAFGLKVIEKLHIVLPLIGTLTVPGIEREILAPLRLLHFLFAVVLVMQLLPRKGRVVESMPARSVARIGQYSLECFAMSTVLAYISCGLLISTNSVTTFNVFICGVVAVLLLCAFAVFMHWLRSEPWRGGGTKKSKQPAETTIATPAGLEAKV